jgi:phosphoadenosine phosphosulfate reductase
MNELEGFLNKEEQAIEILKSFEPKEDGYILAYSGGKDSIVIKHLAERAGVKFQAVYNNTTVDPPELAAFVRNQKDVLWVNPDKNMRELIIQHGVPTQMIRFCCKYLKEKSFPGRITITGVRWAESVKRKLGSGMVVIRGKTKADRIIHNQDNDEARRQVESCYRTNKILVNPIINWTDVEVWNYIKENNLAYCVLYDEGFDRLGCVGCPMLTKKNRERDFKRWPRMRIYYVKAFDAYIARRKNKGNWSLHLPQNGEAMFNFWCKQVENTSGKDYGNELYDE